MLRIFVSKNNLKFTVTIETPSKPFLDWSFPKVCQLYELGESDDPSLSVFPPFTCKYKDLEDESSQVLLKNLITELKARLKSIPISGNEASKSQYVCSYLVAGINLYEGKFELRPEKNITGPNGHGPVDFAIDLLKTAKLLASRIFLRALLRMLFNLNRPYQTVSVKLVRWKKEMRSL